MFPSQPATKPGSPWPSPSALKKVPSFPTPLLRPHPLVDNLVTDINCTIPSISDPFFHLLEFYIHADVPLTCRIPTYPNAGATSTVDQSILAATHTSGDDYIPLVFALAGTLQLSHLHLARQLNVILHTAPNPETSEADIVAATAYSALALSSQAGDPIKIGDSLTLELSVRWYSSSVLPPSTTSAPGLGGHVHLSTVVYCLLSAGVGVAASLAYFRGVELPKRIRRYGKERIGGGGLERGYAFPGVGAMNGFGGGGPMGKRD